MKRSRLVTDGPRVYFTERAQAGWVIAQVATVGGEVIPMSAGALENPLIQDLSQARSELLLTDAAGFDPRPLFTLPLPGGLPRPVGNILATSAAWSPDGQAIAYAAEGGVYLCESDGRQPRKIASVRGVVTNICWHPVGSLLRFTAIDPLSNSISIWEVRPDGTKLHPFLSGWSAQGVRSESWTPDGRFFILTSQVKDSPDLFVLREGGPFAESQRRRLTQLTAGPMEFEAAVPSRDGKRVFSLSKIGQSELQRYDPESRRFVPYLANISADHVDFSKDGQWMAYVTVPGYTLWKRRVNGAQALQLTLPPMITELPRWSPDGKWIAFMGREPAKPWKVRVISAEGGTSQTVTSGGDQEGAPTWSPDGGWVVFGGLVAPDVRSSGPLVIHVVDLRTHEGSTLPGSEGLWTARWSPNGRYVAALTADSQSLMLFDSLTRKWFKLLTGSFIGDIIWSRREESIFLAYATSSGGDSTISRLRLRDRKLEQVVCLHEKSGPFWLGLAPDDSPLITRQAGTQEVYALDWQLP